MLRWRIIVAQRVVTSIVAPPSVNHVTGTNAAFFAATMRDVTRAHRAERK